MRKRLARIYRIACIHVLVALVAPVASADLFDLSYRLQSDASFKEQFLGSYGVLANREPPITEIESVILKKVAEMFEVNTAYAQTMLEAMLKDDTQVSATFNYLLANLYFENEEYLLAEYEYEKAIDKFPTFQRAWRNLGVLRMRGEDVAKAMEAFSKCVELGDVSPGTYGRLAFCHFELGNYHSAEAAYTLAILNDPKNIQWLEGKVEVYMAAKKYPDAIQLLDELIGRIPDSRLYWLAQSNAYLALDRFEDAAANIEVVRSMGEAGTDELVQLGAIYAHMGLGASSYRVFEYASSASNPPASELVKVALSLNDKGQTDHAASILRLVDTTGLDQSPEVGELFYRLRASLAESENQTEQAIAYWTKALELNPINGEYLLKLAALYKGAGQRERAYLLAERAALDESSAFQALLFQSKLLVEDRRFDESLAPLRSAMQIRSSESLQNLYTRIVEANALFN